MAKALRSVSNPWVRTAEPLLWISGCGHEHRTRGYGFDALRRGDSPHWVLQLTLAGNGMYERRGRRTLLPAGTAWLDRIPGDFRYGYPPESKDVYEQVFVSLRGPVADRWGTRIVGSFGHVLRLGERAAPAALMLAIVRQRDEGTLGDRYLVSAQLYQILMTVLSTLNHSRLATEPLVAAALELITAHGGEPGYQIADLAAAMDCSREHLTRRFRAALGVSPQDYLLQHRVRLAGHALRASDAKLETLARQCGFAGANYLCRAFRKQVGVTPGEFRAKTSLLVP